MDSSFDYSPAEVKKIKQIKFGVLGPEEIVSLHHAGPPYVFKFDLCLWLRWFGRIQLGMSVAEIKYAQLYENGIPKDHGLLDLRMGTTEREFKCKSCSGNMTACPGHFGHIDLARPVLHIGFLYMVLRLLRCFCYHCSKLLVSPDKLEFKQAMELEDPKQRQKAMYALCSSARICNGGETVENLPNAGDQPAEQKSEAQGCGNFQPKYRKDGIQILCEFDAKVELDASVDRKQIMSPTKIHEIFKRISDEDCVAFGLDPSMLPVSCRCPVCLCFQVKLTLV